MNSDEFQKAYPTKSEKEEALRKMSDEQIDALIKSTSNRYAKIFYSKFKTNRFRLI